MKILFNDNTLWGLINFRGDVIRHFIAKGDEVLLVAPEEKSLEMKTTIPEGARYIKVLMSRTSFNPTKDISYFLQLWRIFHRERPDFVFNYTIKPNIYGSIAARLTRHCHTTAMMAGLGYIFINKGMANRLARGLYRFGLGFTNHLLLLNSYNMALAEEKHMCNPRKIILLSGGEGVNLTRFTASDNASPVTTFLYIGRILWDKGYDEFTQAARIVREKYPKARFELLGSLDASYPKSVPPERLRQDEADGVVKYLGVTSDIDAVYKRRGIVITLPSYTEGMNRALMEACASGRPIITSDIPGCREMVDEGKNGFLVPIKNAQALAEAMMKYLELTSEQKQTFASYSREKAERQFDMKHVIAVYEKIISEG